jgi:ribonuclease HII
VSIQRRRPSFDLELDIRRGGADLVLGIDEAGRGALAGPLVVSACALRHDAIPEGIDDSKQLGPARRSELAAIIRDSAVTWGIGEVDAAEIDRSGIIPALRVAARRAATNALENLRSHSARRIHFLIDGPIPLIEGEAVTAVIKGDSLSASIAAASILAKVHRDTLMEKLSERYPQYEFERHKGYGTPAHLEALRRYGPSPIHRRSFGPVRQILQVEEPLGSIEESSPQVNSLELFVDEKDATERRFVWEGP